MTTTRKLTPGLAFRAVLLGSAFAIAAPAFAEELPGAGKTIRFAQGDSLGANYVQNQILIAAMKELGYEVQVVNVGISAFFQAAAQGDMDIAADVNMPQRLAAYEKVEDRLDLLGAGTITGGGYNGYVMDKATADAHGVKDISALKDPELAKLFDTDGDGIANLMNCDPGWSCGDVVDFQIEAFGLSDTVKSVRAKYEPLLAETFTRFRSGEPVLYYTWSPSFVTQTLVPGTDVVWVPIPFDALPEGVTSADGHDVAGVMGCAADQDPCKMATGAWNWRITANKDFVAANPAIAKLSEEIEWPITTWSDWEVAIKADSSDRAIKKVADDWIAANQTTFDGWVADAKAAGN